MNQLSHKHYPILMVPRVTATICLLLVPSFMSTATLHSAETKVYMLSAIL